MTVQSTVRVGVAELVLDAIIATVPDTVCSEVCDIGRLRYSITPWTSRSEQFAPLKNNV